MFLLPDDSSLLRDKGVISHFFRPPQDTGNLVRPLAGDAQLSYAKLIHFLKHCGLGTSDADFSLNFSPMYF